MKRGNLDTANLSKNDSRSNILNYKKKIFISILLFTLTLNIFALPVLASNDVAYIFKNKRIVDENIIDVFEGLGLNVELINERNIPNDLSGYKFVYLGDERYRNEDKIKIWKYPAIISNYFYGDDWGLTDRDGISKLASSSPLSIKIGNKITQVYNQAKFNNGVSIPYYYLGEENKADNLETIAQTYTGNGNDIGDVISYGNAGLELENGEVAEDNICFFGIIESNYWTEDVVELLEECVGHVSITCENNNDCEDIDLEEPYCIGKNVAQDTKESQCENPGTIQSACMGDLVTNIIKVCTSNCQDGECICFDNDNDGYDDCNIGEEGDDGKTLDCNDNDNAIHPNAYEICDNKDNNCNNQVDENDGNCGIGNACSLGSCVEIECNVESDCGLDGFFDGRFCDGGSNKDIYQNYIDFTCENPGTISSSCTQEVEAKLITECSDTCSAGSCISIGCNTNNDCQDNNDYTFDECLNAGTLNSYCSHEPIECLNNLDCNDNDDYTIDVCSNMGESDSYCSYEEILCLEDFDCGINGFVNGLSCNENNVVQDYRSYNCENPGTLSSSCTQTIESLIVNECSDTCNTGNCITITCNNDNECEDGNDETTDICLNPGTIDSMCTHEDVLCSNNNDCGTNRYTGELFCNDKKILRNFASFSCNSAGTDASFCSNSIDAIEVYECTYACNGGSCLRCNTQDDCNDGNENTIDVCRFGGSIDSYCSHDVISCFQDNDCGLDSFVGTPFCLENNVYQNFRDLSCTNAGTSGSFCDTDIDPELIESCEFGCSNGLCEDERQCSNGVDDDGDDLTDAQDPGCWDDQSEPSTYNANLNDESAGTSICNDNADCVAGQGGDNYCSENNVVFDQPIPICLSPGTGFSECGLNTVQTLVDECSSSKVCFIDQCIEGCNDNDNDGYDDCSGRLDDECTSEVTGCVVGRIYDSSVNDPVKGNYKNYEVPCDGTIKSYFYDDNAYISLTKPGEIKKQAILACDNEMRGLYSDPNVDFCSSFIHEHGGVLCTRDNELIARLPNDNLGRGCPGKFEDYTIDVKAGDILDMWNMPQAAGHGWVEFTPNEITGDPQCSNGANDDGKDIDCNDNEFNINPGALELCDGIDNNCDGNIDEGTDLDLCGPDNTCTNSQCIPICTPSPNIFNFAYTQDRIFLQDSNVIDWNNNICYDEFYESNGNTYCSGLALKYYDSGASATQLCNMKGYSTATITDSGTWSSCHDNTIAYYNNGVWKTQNGCTGGNRHIDSIQCTNPLNDCL